MKECIALVLFVGKDAGDGGLCPVRLPSGRRNTQTLKVLTDCRLRFSLKEEAVNQPDNSGFLLNNRRATVGAFLITKESLVWQMHFAVREALALAPGDVLGNAPAFLLGKAGHDRDEQFAFAVKGIDALLLEIALHAVFLELADGHQTVHRVSGKAADRFRDDKVDASGKRVSDHFLKAFSAFGVRAGNTLIGVDLHKLPLRLRLNESSVVVHLGFVASELLIAVRGNTSVTGNTPFSSRNRGQMGQRIYGCGYHCNFRHCCSSSPGPFDGRQPSFRPSNFRCVSGLSTDG